jgi:hypothetical protein
MNVNVEIGTKAAQFPEGIHKWNFRCSAEYQRGRVKTDFPGEDGHFDVGGDRVKELVGAGVQDEHLTHPEAGGTGWVPARGGQDAGSIKTPICSRRRIKPLYIIVLFY